MTRAIVLRELGDPDKLVVEEIDLRAPGPGEVLVRHTAVGLNYIDVYHRTGLYPLPNYPAVLGKEAAGVVEEVGAGVTTLKAGDRVAHIEMGAYSERRVFAADRMVRVPQAVSEQHAAAMMLKGLTTQYLVRRTYKVQRGDVVLVHAAAGGVGTILVQWAKHLGATVIGTVGSNEKAALARAAALFAELGLDRVEGILLAIWSRVRFPLR